MAQIKTQADKRRPQAMTDDHGRPWHASVEKASGGITGLIQHLFDVPHPDLVPPQKYLSMDPENASHLRIDYDWWLRDLKERAAEYATDRTRMGMLTSRPAELEALLGPPPKSPKPVQAMQQGNLWALGLTNVKPPEAEEYFPAPVTAESEPVWSGDVFSQPAPSPAPGVASFIAELEARCPAELKGTARNNWLMAEMRKMVAPQTQEA